MMPLRRACSAVLACACAVAGLAGCSSGPPVPVPPPAPHAFALDVTTAGRVLWQVPLAPGADGLQLSPLAVGAAGVAVFAQYNVLYGLNLADGHQGWSWADRQDIAGMWQWQSLVIVLTNPPGGWSQLTGLDADTGQAQWTQYIDGYVAGSYPTADGGLAIIRLDDTLEVVDLSSGRVRWTRPAGYPPNSDQDSPPPMAVGDGAVLFDVNGQLTSYDDRTGRIRWTEAPMPLQLASDAGIAPGLQASAGLVYATGMQQSGVPWTQVLLGISVADGRVKWRIVASSQETVSAYAPGLMSVTSSSGGAWQDEFDPATGRVRWQAASAYQATATPAGTVTAPGTDSTDQISVHDTLTGQTRWTATLAGLNLGWQLQAPALPVFPDGPVLIVPAASPHGPGLLTAFRMSDGHRAWQLTIPEPAAAPPSAVPGGMLVNSAIALTAP
jgi:outer membrane protein assembly factor BamB